MSLELWGGHEMTLKRVGSSYFDQTIRSGHQHRIGDLTEFANLGIRTLRYPVLWERVAPSGVGQCDFSWSDERLQRIRELGMRPIVGLLHHGSGPPYTDLLDDMFPAKFASFARAVAERYPWIEDWTPINEPLTTARFSCLYGHWYPHQRNETACWTALLNQIDAIRMAMKEIRRVNPNARLIQTEDLGFCHATEPLKAQAEFENERPWLTWDLLFGAVTTHHPLWTRVAGQGLERRVVELTADPCPPDIVGVNHYLSSERFIDHRIDVYPGIRPAADGPEPFINVEAVRVLKNEPLGIGRLLEDAWARYRSPLAITECHNGCTRDEQCRWFSETWETAEHLSATIPIAGVTSWALLGSFDWNHLVTIEAGDYEPGAFDVRSGNSRPTAIAHLLKALAAGQEPELLGLSSLGWWKRDGRQLYPAPESIAATQAPDSYVRHRRKKPEGPILITGKTGTLGQALARACARRCLPHVLTGREDFLLEDAAGAKGFLERKRPSAVINAAGVVEIDEAESNPERCMAANVEGPENLAYACKDYDIPLITFSSDQVFDGYKGTSYVESDPLNPLNVYGRSKVEAERRVLAVGGRALVIRTAAFFSPDDSYNFAVSVLRSLHSRKTLFAAEDEFVSPTYVPELVDSVLDLLIDGETGIWHLANRGRVSWASFAALIAERSDTDARTIVPVHGASMGCRAPRPTDVALTSSRCSLLTSLESAIDRFMHACPRHLFQAS